MRRLFRFILMTAVFLGGYYLGRLPGSPDIFAHAAGAYRCAVRTGEKISARAEQDHTSLTKAALACAAEAISDAGSIESRN